MVVMAGALAMASKLLALFRRSFGRSLDSEFRFARVKQKRTESVAMHVAA